jgi:male germ cell-associated kinase
MDRYRITKQLGDGTYGEVLRGSNKQTSEVVAIKRMKRKYHSWDECIALKEARPSEFHKS